MSLRFQGLHAQFIEDDTPEIDLEGARECGKTWADCAKVIRTSSKFPGMQWYFGRYTDQDTMTLIRPVFQKVLGLEGLSAEWDSHESAFHFPTVSDLTSKVFMHGLKAQNIERELSKVRGLDKHAVLVDQAEELPQKISEELRFAIRQPGNYPRQLIFSPNPCEEDHYLTDQFPEECLVDAPPSRNPFPHRRYYRLSIYDNAHNLQRGELAKIEAMFPPTHARYKSLVLGMRGVNVVGVAVHSAFSRERHVQACAYDEARPILEAVQYGQHHPTWLAMQRTYTGGEVVLAAVMGKRMSLDEFLPIVKAYRGQWFGHTARFQTCCDPPPEEGSVRFTNINMLRDHGMSPVWRPNAVAPDVREAVIQSLAKQMRQRDGFVLNSDPDAFVMVSRDVRKHSNFFVDGLESAYVWDDHTVSVGNKQVRRPKQDEWIEGAQRCLENIHLNFCAEELSDAARDGRDAKPGMTERERKRWDALDEGSRHDIERLREYAAQSSGKDLDETDDSYPVGDFFGSGSGSASKLW
jgi:hypothetical protein